MVACRIIPRDYSVLELAKAVDIAPKNLLRVIKYLEKEGLIKIVDNGRGRKKTIKMSYHNFGKVKLNSLQLLAFGTSLLNSLSDKKRSKWLNKAIEEEIKHWSKGFKE